jgi:hypothetical protein
MNRFEDKKDYIYNIYKGLYIIKYEEVGRKFEKVDR